MRPGTGIIGAGEASLGTDPLRPGTDGDGLSDYEGLLLGTDPLTPNGYDAARGSDGDGLADLDEAARHRTDPHAKDTDFDGLSDIRQGSVEGSVAKPEVSCVQYSAEGGI